VKLFKDPFCTLITKLKTTKAKILLKTTNTMKVWGLTTRFNIFHFRSQNATFAAGINPKRIWIRSLMLQSQFKKLLGAIFKENISWKPGIS
jgi:hypothetical protein